MDVYKWELQVARLPSDDNLGTASQDKLAIHVKTSIKRVRPLYLAFVTAGGGVRT